MFLYYAQEFSDLTEYIKNEPLVTGVAVAWENGGLVIAILTEPIFFKSEGDNLIKRISLYAAAAYPDCEITVTRDAAVYYRIKANNT